MDETEERFEELIEKGHEAAWDQDWELAIDCYQKALEINRNKAAVWIGLGYAYSALNRLEEAFDAYSSASKIDANDPIPAERLAQIAHQLGYSIQAAGFAMRAGELYLKNRDLPKTIENWAFAAKCNPQDLQIHTLLAKIYEKSNQPEQAVHELMVMAAIHQRQGRMDKAKELLLQAQQLLPESQEAIEALKIIESGKQLPLVELEKQIPSPAKKVPSYSSKTVADREVDLLGKAHQLALSQLAEGFFEGNNITDEDVNEKRGLSSWVSGAKGIFNRQPDILKIKKYLGDYLAKVKENEMPEALADLENAIQAGLNHPAAYFELGYGYHRQRKYDQVEKALSPALKESAYQVASYLLIGDSYYQRGKLLEATRAYYQALMKIDLESVPESQRGELEKAYAPYLETIAQQKDEENLKQVCKEISSILFSRDWQKRIRQIREQLNARQLEGEIIPIGSLFSEAGGLNAMNIISSIQSLARSGNFRTAIEELYYTLQFMPTYLPLHILLGDLLLEHGFTEDAFTKLFIVAKTYDVRGEKEKALELYRRLTDISPMNTLVRQKLIDLLSEKGEVNECLQEYLNLAEAFYTLADLRQARETYEKAYQYVLQNNLGKNMQVMVLHLIGDLDIQNLDWKSALEIYQQIRELEPNDEKARILTMELNYRLHNLAQALKDLDAYLDFLEQNNKLVQAHNFLKQLELDYPDWKDLPSRTTRIANKLNKGK